MRDGFGKPVMTWLGWALLSALFAAMSAFLAKLGVKGVDANLGTAIRTSVVAVLSWAIVAAFPAPATVSAISRCVWLFLILSGIATGLSWLCYFHALQSGQLTRVAPVDKLSVVLTIMLGALFLGEPLTWRGTLGASLIAAGVIMIAFE